MIATTNQVCSVALAKKLSAVGVEVDSMFTWVFDNSNMRWDLSGLPITAIRLIDSGQPQREAYAAYTVYEFGIMFGSGTLAIEKLYTDLQRKMNQGLSMAIVFESDYLAKQLFYSIANNFTTAQECVERMNKVAYDYSKIDFAMPDFTAKRTLYKENMKKAAQKMNKPKSVIPKDIDPDFTEKRTLSFNYCQSLIEDNGKCAIQCDHCKEYNAPLEKEDGSNDVK